MVQLKKDNTNLSGVQVTNNVWTVKQNTNKLAVADPNYASVKNQPKSTYNVNTDPLWKQAGKAIINAVDPNPYKPEDFHDSPVITNNEEIRPKDTFEETAWGWNYDYDRAVSQADNQQGHYNALNGTWHVVWIPEGVNQWLQLPQDEVWERLATWTHNFQFPQKTATVSNTPTQQTPVKTWGTKNVATPTQQANPEQPQQEWNFNPVSDDFWYWNRPEGKPDNSDYNNGVLANMQADLGQSTAWELYGKVWADMNGSVQTLQDANSVYTTAVQWRISNMKSLLSQDPYDIAISIAGGFNPYGDQAMRDLMQYAPERYQAIQDEIKKINAWENANAIAWGTSGISTTWASTASTNNGVDTWANSISSSPYQASTTIHNLTNAMANNQVATTATQEMLNINAQIAEYEEKLNNLERDTRAMFKGDVPDYLVKAAMANKRQLYQSEINKLESRYNSALDLYKTELSNAQWQEEMKLKYLQYQQGVSNDNWTRYYQSQQLKLNQVKRVDGKAYQMNLDGTFTQLTDGTAYMNYQNDVSSALQWYKSIYTSWGATKTANWYKYNVSGGQCETFTDNFTEATTGLRMTGEGGRGRTTAEEKIWYINSFVPEVWSVAVAVWGAYDSKYWHTMLVTWYDPNTWIVDLLWSNKDGDEMVYSTQATLSDLQARWLKGFWNPYKDLQAQSMSGMWQYMYSWFNTPMSQAFERISSDSSLNWTQRNALPIALEMYDTLYEIANNGQLQALVDNGDLALIMNDFKNKKFSNADKWEKFLDAFTKALNNKAASLVWGDDSYAALMALQRVIEAKLRDESWAAISSSEWATNFSYLLPQAWETAYIKNEKLKAWDRIISTKFITAWGKMSEYVPIFEDYTVREIWWY